MCISTLTFETFDVLQILQSQSICTFLLYSYDVTLSSSKEMYDGKS
jgi:hypothetical protein